MEDELPSAELRQSPEGYKEMMQRLDVVCSQLKDVKDTLVDTSMKSHLLNIDILTLISPETMDIIESSIIECNRSEMQLRAMLPAANASASVGGDAEQTRSLDSHHSGNEEGRGSQRLKKKEEEETRRRLEEEEKARLQAEEEANAAAEDSEESNDDAGSSEEASDSDEVDSDNDGSGSDESSSDDNAEEDSDDDRAQSRVVGPIQPGGSPRKRAPVAKKSTPAKKKKAPAEDDDDLFSLVKGGRYAFKLIADDWISDYKKEKGGAMTKLIQFIVTSSGCKASVTQEMVVSRNFDSTFKKLTQDFGEDSAEYPLIMTGPSGKKFKTNFVDFLDYLILQCQHTLLYDGFFLDHLLPWLMTMTTSQVQAFRHTSTLAAMKLCTSFITVAQNVRKEFDNLQRLIDVERQKSGNRRTAERIETLEGQLDERKDEVSELEEHMQKIFSGVFVMRYRDAKPDIRSLCIHEMGEWMHGYSSTFLADMYLKYIGWLMYDQVSEVRTMALIVLERLYNNEEFHENLYLFTQKFKNRIVEMVMDVDEATGSHAVRVACVLLKMDVLDGDNCEQIYQLVFVRPRALAHAAGDFLVKFLFNEERLAKRQKEEEAASQKSSSPRKRGRGAGKKAAALAEVPFKLKELAKFFIECQAGTTVEYFIDSIWPHMEELKMWDAFTSLLLEDSGLTTEEEACVIDMMSTCIKRAVGGSGPPFRGHKKALLSKKEKLSFEEQKSEISSHFMSCLPALMRKFDADAEKVVDLMAIPRSFDLQLYSELRLQKQLSDLLDAIHRIIFKHSSSDVFQESARTLEYLQSSDNPLQSSVDVAVESLMDAIVAEMKDAHSKYMKSKSKAEKDGFALTVHLRRIACLTRYLDTSKWVIFNEMQALLAQGCEDPGAMGDELLVECLSCLGCGLIALVSLIPSQASSSELKNTVRLLRSHLQEFVSRCDELISFSSLATQNHAFAIVSDVLIASHALKFNKDPQIAALVPDLEIAFQDRCKEYIIANVLLFKDPEPVDNDEDEDIELQEQRSQELVERRCALAAFCKLVIFNVFQLRFGAPILCYYTRCFPDYGDIIKLLLSKLRETNHIDCAKTMMLALQLQFEEICYASSGVVDRQSRDWVAAKELAKRFALSVGVDASRNTVREMIITMHREGVVYSLSSRSNSTVSHANPDTSVPGNVEFFDILSELVSRLLPTDRNKPPSSILNFLDERLAECEQMPKDVVSQLRLSKWHSLHRYRSALSTGSSSKGAATTPTLANQPSALLDEFDDAASDISTDLPPAKRKNVGRGRRPSTSRTSNKKVAADDVWLQRPSEAEVRQQKLEKARSSAARARSGQARASTSGRSKRTASVGHDTSHSAGRKRPRSASSSEEEPDDVLISPKTFQRPSRARKVAKPLPGDLFDEAMGGGSDAESESADFLS